MMFLISEVHPFIDGNGRIARIMMNAELVRGKQSKIIIPTVFRDDYISALRRLSRLADPVPYIKMLQFAHEFSAALFGEDKEKMYNLLVASNAFSDPDESTLRIK